MIQLIHSTLTFPVPTGKVTNGSVFIKLHVHEKSFQSNKASVDSVSATQPSKVAMRQVHHTVCLHQYQAILKSLIPGYRDGVLEATATVSRPLGQVLGLESQVLGDQVLGLDSQVVLGCVLERETTLPIIVKCRYDF